MHRLASLSAAELLSGYATTDFSPVEAVDALLGRIEEVEPRLRAFLTVTADPARLEAESASRAWREGRARPLEGVPFAAKDLFDTAGVRTTYGSPMYREHVPAVDAAAVVRAREAGAILLGKTSTHEFAWGLTSHNAHFDSGRNPWALDRVTGGSSGGSAAALAACEVPLALGTDTGGSIRIPAAFCGVVGLKPSFDRVSAAGVFPLAPSLDHVGQLARTPADAALFLSVLGGGELVPPASLEGVRFAACEDLVLVEPVGEVRAALEASVSALGSLGAVQVDVELPEAGEIVETFRVLQGAEALRSHRRAGTWPARRDEYGADVRGRLEWAESVDLDAYADASFARERIRAGFERLFARTDLLVTPVAATSPVRLGEEEVDVRGGRSLFRELVLPFTTPHNLAGLPSCVVRAGFDGLGVPIGVQLAARPGADALVAGASQCLFDATPELQARRPDLP